MLVVILSIFAKLCLSGLLIPIGYMYSSYSQIKITNMSLSQNNEVHYSSSNLLELSKLKLKLYVNHNNLVRIKCNSSDFSSIALINARSIRSNSDIINDFISTHRTDIIAITETWINDNNSSVSVNEITPADSTFLHVDRHGGKTGGGVGLLCRNSFKPTMCQKQNISVSFESIIVNVKTEKCALRICVLYRPPSSSFRVFCDEFTALIEDLKSTSTPFVVLGDFNIHFDNKTASNTQSFCDILDSFNLTQHVTCPTHIKGHTLDLIITSESVSKLLLSQPIADSLISDHFAVRCSVSIVTSKSIPENTIKMRKTKDMDMNAFKQDLLSSDLVCNPADDIDDLVSQYNMCLKSLMDIHAPIKTVKVKDKRNPLYSSEIHSMRQRKRALQRKYHKSRSEHDLKSLIQCRDELKELIKTAKIEHFSKVINENQRDQSKLFRVVKSMLHNKPDMQIPTETTQSDFSNKLNDFFISKNRENKS